jgi:hypothetical protein
VLDEERTALEAAAKDEERTADAAGVKPAT